MSSETFTVPRASVERWAADSLHIAAGLATVSSELVTATDDIELRRQVAQLQEMAAALVLDFASHDVMPDDPPRAGSVGDGNSSDRQRLMLVPNVPAAVLEGIDKIDPLGRGFTRANSAHFLALAPPGSGVDDDVDYDRD